MRIISGKYKQCKIVSPKISTKFELRPTKGKVKAAFFNILGKEIVGKNFLDLFCGTGSIGLEALSRGAAHVTFVDINAANISAIRQTIDNIGVVAGVDFITIDILNLNNLSSKYDIIYVDPPYHKKYLPNTLKIIERNQIYSEDCYVVFEGSVHEKLDVNIDSIFFQSSYRRYGNTSLTFFRPQR